MAPINGGSDGRDVPYDAFKDGGSKSAGSGGGRGGSHEVGKSTPDDEFDEQPKKAPARKTRYGRSATISVAQLLSDGCSSLLQKFRRNPSEKPEKKLARSESSEQQR